MRDNPGANYGARPDTVLKNTQELNVDLSGVHEVVLTHSHWDHVSGLLTLRRELMKRNPDALSIVHVPVGIFDRPTVAKWRGQSDDRDSQRV